MQIMPSLEVLHFGLDLTEIFDVRVLRIVSKLQNLRILSLAPGSRHEITTIPNFPGLSLYSNKERSIMPSREFIDLESLLRVFAELPSLVQLNLKLCGFNLKLSGPSIPIPTITSLQVSQAHFPDNSTMVKFLASFPSLTSFDYACHIGGESTFAPLATSLSTMANTLFELRLTLPVTFVEQPGETEFVHKLACIAMPKLERLYLHVRPIDSAVVSKFSGRHHPLLRHIVLRKGPGWSQLPSLCEIGVVIDSGSWPNLRKLDLQEFLVRETRPPTDISSFRGGRIEIRYWRH
jgi:hypothetical protein